MILPFHVGILHKSIELILLVILSTLFGSLHHSAMSSDWYLIVEK